MIKRNSEIQMPSRFFIKYYFIKLNDKIFCSLGEKVPGKSNYKISRIEMILNQINEINNFQQHDTQSNQFNCQAYIYKKYRSNYFQLLFITEREREMA